MNKRCKCYWEWINKEIVSTEVLTNTTHTFFFFFFILLNRHQKKIKDELSDRIDKKIFSKLIFEVFIELALNKLVGSHNKNDFVDLSSLFSFLIVFSEQQMSMKKDKFNVNNLKKKKEKEKEKKKQTKNTADYQFV